jgi:hypothetical protein
MNRMMRFSSAAFGIILLAGLAFHQGRVELTPGEEDLMSGTAHAESVEIPNGNCESMADPNAQGADSCSEKERSSGTN